MKVLLLNPPDENNGRFIREGRCTQEASVWSVLWPPITLATIGAMLSEYEVIALDAPATNFPFASFSDYIKKYNPNVVVYTTGSPSIENDLNIASLIKESISGAITIAIGTHVSTLDEKIMSQNPSLDIIVRGEPEVTVLECVNKLSKDFSVSALSDVAGITYRRNDQIIKNNDRLLISDLDSLPVPAWDLFDLENYRLPLSGERFVLVLPQRGCPWKCSFCTAPQYYGSKIRSRSSDKVANEIRTIQKLYNIHDFFFWSDTFTASKKYVQDLCEAIKPLGVRWTCNSRVDTFDAEIAQLLKDAGCWMISFGIESGDQKVLDLSQKGITPKQSEEAVHIAKKYGLKVAGHFILGLPGENTNSLNKTLEFSKRLSLDVAQFYCATAFPGTKLYNEAVKNGWIEVQDNLSQVDQLQLSMNIPTVSKEEILHFKRRANRSFYLSGRPFVFAIEIFSFKYLMNNLKLLFKFVRRTWN